MARRSKKQDKPYDDAFKYLAEQDAEALLLLLGEIEPGEKAEITPLQRELRISTRLPDQAYRIVTAAGERIVHIEAQSRYDHFMPERMADYGVREWMKYRLPITCYVLLLTDRDLPERTPRVGRIEAGDVRISVRYRLIRLSQIAAARLLALQRDNLLPFVPLMRGGTEELEAGARKLSVVESERQQLQLGLDFLLLGTLRYNPEDLLDLIGRESMIPLKILKETPGYEFLINEGKDRWKEEGRAEGLKKGRREGRREGLKEGLKEGQMKALAETLRLLVAKRFPGANLTRKLKRIQDVSALQQLLLEFDEIPDAAVLRQRLDAAIKAQTPQ